MKRWDVVAAALAAVALLAATAQVGIAVRAVPESLPEKLIAIAVVSPAVVLGLIVARRIPANPVGAVLVLIGAESLVDLTLEVWGQSGATASAVPGAPVAGAVAESAWMLHYLGPILLALIFPTGRLLSPRWRAAVAGLVLVPLGFALTLAFAPPVVAEVTTPAFLLGLLGLLVTAVVSVVLRYRRSGERERRQLRWLTVSAILLPAILLLCWVEFSVLGTTNGVGLALAVLVIALPLSVAIAMLRHSLWGYDRLLAGTVRWAVIVAVVGIVFAVAALLLGVVFGTTSPIAASAATLLAVVVARPLHRVIRRGIDARFQPRRERSLAAVRRFVTDLRDGRAQPEELDQVLQTAGAGVHVVVDADGARLEADDPGVTPVDLRELDAEARLPLELTRLRADLREALAQTDASRARLVAAADGERRRIQRDLHDGAQSNLVALGMRLRGLQRHRADDATLDAELSESVELVQRTISDLRAMAQGVRPSSLDEGLEVALRAMVRSVPLPVDLDLEPVAVHEPRATAAYYLAAEAVTNALKHARPGRIGISLGAVADGIRLAIRDDGSGGAVEAIGSGLSGVRDRVEAAGGTLRVSSAAGTGTLVEAVFP